MDRTIVNEGEYIEVECENISGDIEKLEEAEIIVLTNMRIELADKDKSDFLRVFKKWYEFFIETSPYFNQLDETQRSDATIRKMLTHVPNFNKAD
jgi:3-phosphoglycerate kinase